MSTIDELSEIIAKITHCSPNTIAPETALKEVDADSLHWVQIIVAVENAFDIEIDIDKMQEMVTIEDFIKYIDSCIN